MNEELRLVTVHEAAHAVIGRVLGYDIATITVDRGYGFVRTRGVEARGWDREPEHAIYCLAGIVAEERAGGDYVCDTILAAVFNEDGSVNMGFNTEPLPDNHDLVGAWDAVDCDYTRLEEALGCTYRAVRCAWRRIDAVARHLERVRTVSDGGDPYALRPLLEGRGHRWYERTIEAMHAA